MAFGARQRMPSATIPPLIISRYVRTSQGQGRIATETSGIIEDLAALTQSETTLPDGHSGEGATLAGTR